MSDEAKASCYCAAHGCPLLGVFGNGKDWFCFLHRNKDASKFQPITVEINRREWLSKTITDLRMHYGTEKWADTCRAAQHEFVMHQRKDLKANGERAWEWIRRLENELHGMVTGTGLQQKQERLAA